MATVGYEKMYTQLKAKPVVWKKYVKHNKPKEKKVGLGARRCRRCGRFGAHVRRVGMCRQCFRDIAKKLGFRKFN